MKHFISLLTGIMMFIPGYAQVNSLSYIKVLKTCKDQNQFVNIIRKIGTPDSIIKENSTASMQNSSIYDVKFLQRAETFKVNLDNDPLQEFVTQVVFLVDTQPCHERWEAQQNLIYHIYIHDDSIAANKLLAFYDFHEISLEGSKPVTFGFEATKKGYSRIVFTFDRIESCGVWEYSAYKQKDTLVYVKSRFEYLPGNRFDEDYENFRTIIEDE